VSWNVNGLRTLRPSLGAVLESLEADIVCLQETRIAPGDADLERLALVPGWHSFFSFCTVRDGYSGVATYTRIAHGPARSSGCNQNVPTPKPRPNVTPLDANEGLLGPVGGADVDVDDELWASAEHGMSDNCLSGDDKDALGNCCQLPTALKPSDYVLIRDEGRVVISDHGLFVLFNIYIPAVSVEGRARFKLTFCRALERKVRALRAVGRHVIVVGDWNIAPFAIDVADDVSDTEAWNKRPSRAWLRDVMMGEMAFVDSYRVLHPHQRDAFTCWSEATRARENNFGVRIDLILADDCLFRQCVRAAHILPHVLGSDHCPASLDLCDEPFMLENLPTIPPAFCTKFLPRFTAKQVSIRALLAHKKANQDMEYCSVCRNPTCSCPRHLLHPRPGSPTADTSLGYVAGVGRLKRPRSSPIGRTMASAALSATRTEKATSQQSRIQTFFKPDPNGAPSLKRPRPRAVVARDLNSSVGGGGGEVNRNSADCVDENTRADESTKDRDAAVMWRTIFTGPPAPPRCRHNLPCVSRLVKKSGPNKGRTFFACERPAGKWPTDRGANCEYFAWRS
jgi:AP endonuclease 2